MGQEAKVSEGESLAPGGGEIVEAYFFFLATLSSTFSGKPSAAEGSVTSARAQAFVHAHLCLVTARYHGTNPTQKLRNTSLVCISMKTGDLKGNLLIGGTAGERVKNSETAAKTGRAGILKNILSIIVIRAMVSETCSLT